MVTITLTEKQAKTLRKILASERREYTEGLIALVSAEIGLVKIPKLSKKRRKKGIKWTAVAINILDNVVDQITEELHRP